MSDEQCCRICLSNELLETTDKFISPCKCKGTIQFVHSSCLERWRASRPGGEPMCSICKTLYTKEKETWQERLKKLFTFSRPDSLLSLAFNALRWIAYAEGIRLAALHSIAGVLLSLKTAKALLEDHKETLIQLLTSVKLLLGGGGGGRGGGGGDGFGEAQAGEEVRIVGVAGVAFLILELGLSFALGRVWGQALFPMAVFGGFGGAVHGFVRGYFGTYARTANLLLSAGKRVGLGLVHGVGKLAVGLIMLWGWGRSGSGGRGRAGADGALGLANHLA